MTRPLQRISSTSRLPENGRSHDGSSVLLETEECQSQGRASLLILLSGAVKRSLGHCKFQQKLTEDGFKNSSNTGMTTDACALKSLLGSSQSDKNFLPQSPEVSSMCFQAGSQVHSKRGLSATLGKIVILSFISIFVLIAVLGSSGSSYPSSSTPRLLYNSYRRLRDEISIDFTKGGIFGLGNLHPKELMVCPRELEHHVPCYNMTLPINADFRNGGEYDRHCELSGARRECLIPPPKQYKASLHWPLSKTSVCSGNVKHTRDDLVARQTRVERLMLEEDNMLTFGSLEEEGTHFQKLASIIGSKTDSNLSEIGNNGVLDIGCSFGGFVAHLVSEGFSALCIAPYEAHNSHVQLALERGLPAMIGSLVTRELPFSSSSFSMIHCSDCKVDWNHKDGLLLFEVDRLLRPGGLFVWVPLLTSDEKLRAEASVEFQWKSIEETAKHMCWEAFPQKEFIFVWKKAVERVCHSAREPNMTLLACEVEDDSDAIGVYRSLQRCLVPMDDRLLSVPNSLPTSGFAPEELSDDPVVWSATLKSYWSLITPLIFSDHPKRPAEDDPLPPPNVLRNVMDMNALYGGFNAALLQAGKSAWVMNVVPTSSSNTLPVIYNRGLIGALHNWCEAFPTYPRTYDLLHAVGLLSQIKQKNQCHLSNLLLEMDRILRPEGWVLLRDNAEAIEEARIAASQMRWDARVLDVEGANDLRLLVGQKSFWKK